MAYFSDVLKIINGKNQKKVENPNGKYPIYGSGGIMGYADDYICSPGTVIIGRKGSINKPIFVEEPFWNVDTAFGLQANPQKLLSKYLYYFCVNFDFERLSTTVTIPSLTKANLLQIEINLPDIFTQKQIINKLDAITDLILLRKKQLKELDQLVKSYFIEMFGDPVLESSKWKWIPVGEICNVTKLAGFEYSEYIHYQDSGDVIMIRGLNVKDKKLKLENVYYIDSKVSDMLPRSQLKENDIVMTYIGVNIGDVALVDGKYRYHLAPNVAKISINNVEEINPIFLVSLFAFNKERFSSNATNTAKQALNMSEIRKLKVMMPPIQLQNQFSMFSQKIDESKFVIKQSLERLETLKKSLMQEYFG